MSCSDTVLQVELSPPENVMFRYCIASRSISPCELILREDAAAAGPYAKSKPVCLQCFKKVSF